MASKVKRVNFEKVVMARSAVITAARNWKKIYCFQDGTHGPKNDEALEVAQERLFIAIEKLEAL